MRPLKILGFALAGFAWVFGWVMYGALYGSPWGFGLCAGLILGAGVGLAMMLERLQGGSRRKVRVSEKPYQPRPRGSYYFHKSGGEILADIEREQERIRDENS